MKKILFFIVIMQNFIFAKFEKNEKWPIIYQDFYDELKNDLSKKDFEKYYSNKNGWFMFLSFKELKDPFMHFDKSNKSKLDFNYIINRKNSVNKINITGLLKNKKFENKKFENKRNDYRIDVAVIAQNYVNTSLKELNFSFNIGNKDIFSEYEFYDNETYFKFYLHYFNPITKEIIFDYNLIICVELGKDEKVYFGNNDFNVFRKLNIKNNSIIKTQVMQLIGITNEEELSNISNKNSKDSYVIVRVTDLKNLEKIKDKNNELLEWK